MGIKDRQQLLHFGQKKLKATQSFHDALTATASRDLERGVITRENYEKIVSKSQRTSVARKPQSPKKQAETRSKSCAVCLQHFSKKVKKFQCSACRTYICSACCTICPDICTGEQGRLCNACLEAEQDNVIDVWDDSTWQTEVHPCIRDAMVEASPSKASSEVFFASPSETPSLTLTLTPSPKPTQLNDGFFRM